MSAQRKIIHADCDCFFAAIEMRDDPHLRGRPMAVGGSAERRGVISTCNYEARAFGVHSAMATATAKRRCPGLLVVPHNMARYREAAVQIRDIFYDYSDRVEPLSLDEAFIDVTGSDHFGGSATLIAEEIRRRVQETVGITISAGVAPNKFLAKIGSDWNKPDGLCVISPGRIDEFVRELPVQRLYGVGRVTASKMQQLGIEHCGDLRRFTLFELAEMFGSFGSRLFDLARGIDERPVSGGRRRKSLSIEHTYASDLSTLDDCLQQLPILFQQLHERLANQQAGAEPRKQFVKFKFSDFQSTTVECPAAGPPRISVYRRLFDEAFERGLGREIRLLGLGVRFPDCDPTGAVQLPLSVNW